MNVGIDLGTTYSMIAHLGPQGVPVLVPDAQDASWVLFAGDVSEKGAPIPRGGRSRRGNCRRKKGTLEGGR